jgi:hypothetical protein
LGGIFAGGEAAGDEVVAGIEEDDVGFEVIADKWLRGIAEHNGLT